MKASDPANPYRAVLAGELTFADISPVVFAKAPPPPNTLPPALQLGGRVEFAVGTDKPAGVITFAVVAPRNWR